LVKIEVEGIEVEIISRDSEIKVEKDTLGLFKVRCPNCAAQIKIGMEKLRAPLPVSAKTISNPFEDIKTTSENSKRWNEFPKGLSEFFLHQRRYSYNLAGSVDNVGLSVFLECATCGREFYLPATYSNPVKRKPDVSLIEAWKTFDHGSELSVLTLTRVAPRYRKTAETLAAYINGLIKDVETIVALFAKLEKTVAETKVQAETAQHFIEVLNQSLAELPTGFKEHTELELKSILTDLRDAASSARPQEQTREGEWKMLSATSEPKT
jgi:hypothetical protein